LGETAFAGVGGVVDWYLGGADGFLYALIAFVVIDYITGVLRAIVEKQLSSRVSSKGITKKVALFLIIGIGHLVDAYVLGGSNAPIRTAVIFFTLRRLYKRTACNKR
jgi:toxin secretion/phage lysis holin